MKMINLKKLSEKQLIAIAITLVLVISLTIYGLTNHNERFVIQNTNQVELSGEFKAPRTVADSVIVWDINANKAIYRKNAERPRPLASITKMMASLVAIENAPKDSTIVVDQQALDQDGDSGLILGEIWQLKDLIDFSLVESSNDGITAIASAVGATSEGLPGNREAGRVSFIDRMNSKAQELGLANMSFDNESGLDIYKETSSGAQGSAEDVAKLFSYVLKEHPEILEATKEQYLSIRSISGNVHTAENTNNAIGRIPSLIGSKTGYTDVSGGNLAVIIDPEINYPIAIVVLGSTFDDRFEDVVKLSDATLEYLKYARHN